MANTTCGCSGMFMKVAVLLLLSSALAAPVSSQDILCKTVGPDWSWFGDHFVRSITYLAVGTPGRKFEMGTGVFAWGKPWGSKIEVTGTGKMTAYGAGALHIRQIGPGSPFKVCMSSRDIEVVKILDKEF